MLEKARPYYGRAFHPNEMEYYGHTANDKEGRRLPECHWQLLRKHLRNVANSAKKFAAPPGLSADGPPSPPRTGSGRGEISPNPSSRFEPQNRSRRRNEAESHDSQCAPPIHDAGPRPLRVRSTPRVKGALNPFGSLCRSHPLRREDRPRSAHVMAATPGVPPWGSPHVGGYRREVYGEGWVRCRIGILFAPTFSAVKGIFESVLRWKSVGGAGDSPAPFGDPPNGIVCVKNTLRRVAGGNWPVACATHTTNYGGPLRARDAMNKGTSYSLARRTGEGGRRLGEGRRCHDERICCTSAAPDYVGPFRPETRVCEIENHELPTLLRMGFDQMQNEKNRN